MNFSSFLSLAAFRTRSSACDTRSRPCVRCVLCSFAFPSAPALCYTGSAASATDVASALFVGFPAPIAGSDFSRSCIIGYGSSPPRCGPAAIDRAVERELSRFPVTRSVCTCQGLRPRRAIWTLALSRPYVLPSASRTASAPEIRVFRGSMVGLCTPLPTLRLHPRGYPRTAWGRCGSLLLHRGGLSPLTPCRFHRRTLLYPPKAAAVAAPPLKDRGRDAACFFSLKKAHRKTSTLT